MCPTFFLYFLGAEKRWAKIQISQLMLILLGRWPHPKHPKGADRRNHKCLFSLSKTRYCKTPWKTKRLTTASRLTKCPATFIFPLLFGTFNLVYWATYLNRSHCKGLPLQNDSCSQTAREPYGPVTGTKERLNLGAFPYLGTIFQEILHV